MTSEDAAILYMLQRIWEGMYKLNRDSDGVWSASRLVGGVSLITADTGSDLRELIGEDYMSLVFGAQATKR